MSDETSPDPRNSTPETSGRRALSPAAERALAEAEARRAVAAEAGALPAEVNGRKGLEPTRFGDWEKNGILSDF